MVQIIYEETTPWSKRNLDYYFSLWKVAVRKEKMVIYVNEIWAKLHEVSNFRSQKLIILLTFLWGVCVLRSNWGRRVNLSLAQRNYLWGGVTRRGTSEWVYVAEVPLLGTKSANIPYIQTIQRTELKKLTFGWVYGDLVCYPTFPSE